MEVENKTERLNISLPRKTLELIDQVWRQSQFKSRSAFLDEAARRYAFRLQRARLKHKLRDGYRARADQSLYLVNEWETASTELLADETHTHRNQE